MDTCLHKIVPMIQQIVLHKRMEMFDQCKDCTPQASGQIEKPGKQILNLSLF